MLGAGQGALFPDPASVGSYPISVWPAGSVYLGGSVSGHGEICTVTALSSNTLTITRAAESSTARAIVVGDQVAMTITAAMLTNLKADSLTAHRTRAVWLPAGIWTLEDGAPDRVARGSVGLGSGTLLDAWAFDAATLETLVTSLFMPVDYDGNAFSIKLYWTPSTTNTGVVSWNIVTAPIAPASQIDQSISGNITVNQAGAGIAENLQIATFSSFTFNTEMQRIVVARQGAVGADTYTADAWFIGLRLEYTADM